MTLTELIETWKSEGCPIAARCAKEVEELQPQTTSFSETIRRALDNAGAPNKCFLHGHGRPEFLTAQDRIAWLGENLGEARAELRRSAEAGQEAMNEANADIHLLKEQINRVNETNMDVGLWREKFRAMHRRAQTAESIYAGSLRIINRTMKTADEWESAAQEWEDVARNFENVAAKLEASRDKFAAINADLVDKNNSLRVQVAVATARAASRNFPLLDSFFVEKKSAVGKTSILPTRQSVKEWASENVTPSKITGPDGEKYTPHTVGTFPNVFPPNRKLGIFGKLSTGLYFIYTGQANSEATRAMFRQAIGWRFA